MNLLIESLPNKGVQALIRSAAAGFGIEVVPDDESDSREARASRRADWDLLVLGAEIGHDDLPARIESLSRENPSGFILVVGGANDIARRGACLRAGALEVLPCSPSRLEIELAVGRAATLIHRVERRIHDEKLEGISQLAVSVNHEVNNPLMGLMGTAEMILLENANLPEKVRRDLRTVIDQARRIQSITLRLRDLDHLRTVPYDDRAAMIDLLGSADEPGAEIEAALDRPRRRKPRPQTPTPPDVFGSPRLLIVDDNQLIIDLIHRLLDERFDIEHAVRPSEALRKVKAAEYDIILLDLILPEMDGLELFRAICEIRPGQRVILTTGYDSDPRVRQALQEGALNWIQKPFKFESLEEMLQSAVRGGRLAGPPSR